MFRKSWLSLAGVLGDLGAGHDTDLPLLDLGLRHFAAEWPARLLAPADSRAFSTHVSTADLLRAAANTWPAGLRYWLRLLGFAGAENRDARRADGKPTRLPQGL